MSTCDLCKSSDNDDDLYLLESTFTYENRPIQFGELLEPSLYDAGSKVCEFCLLKLKAKFILSREKTWSKFEPIGDDDITIENPTPSYSNGTCCENCFTTDQSKGLFEMTTTSFSFDGRKVTLVDCFTFCIGLPPEDMECPFMCRSCMRAMKADYLKKHHATSFLGDLHPKLTSAPLTSKGDTSGMKLIKFKPPKDNYDSPSEPEVEEEKPPICIEKERLLFDTDLPFGKRRSNRKKKKPRVPFSRRAPKPRAPASTLEETNIKLESPNKTDDEYAESDVEYEAIEAHVQIKEEPIDDPATQEPAFNEVTVKIEPELMIGDQAFQMNDDNDDYQLDGNDPAFDLAEDELHTTDVPDNDSAPATPPDTNSHTTRHTQLSAIYTDVYVKQRFECKFCPVYFRVKDTVVRHVHQRHAEMINKPFTLYTDHMMTRKINGTMTYFCTKCRAELPTYREFKNHVYFVHNDGVVWPVFQCDICEDGFADSNALERHKQKRHEARKSVPLMYQGKPIERI